LFRISISPFHMKKSKYQGTKHKKSERSKLQALQSFELRFLKRKEAASKLQI